MTKVNEEQLENIFYRKKFNPLDYYWDLLTVREMAMEVRKR